MAVNNEGVFQTPNVLNVNVNNFNIPQYNGNALNNFVFNPQWPHVPPMNINWGVPTENYPVKFTGNSNTVISNSGIPENPSVPSKRKSLDYDVDQHPSKMLITEEKMTAKMRGLHIGNSYVSHDDGTVEPIITEDLELETQEGMNQKNPQLYMCSEMQNWEMIPSIIPDQWINRGNNSRALVVWKPPKHLRNDENDSDDRKSSVVITDVTDSYIDEDNPIISNNVTIPLPYKSLSSNAGGMMDVMEM